MITVVFLVFYIFFPIKRKVEHVMLTHSTWCKNISKTLEIDFCGEQSGKHLLDVARVLLYGGMGANLEQWFTKCGP